MQQIDKLPFFFEITIFDKITNQKLDDQKVKKGK